MGFKYGQVHSLSSFLLFVLLFLKCFSGTIPIQKSSYVILNCCNINKCMYPYIPFPNVTRAPYLHDSQANHKGSKDRFKKREMI